MATQLSCHDHSLVGAARGECGFGSHAILIPSGAASGGCQSIALLTGERPVLS